MDISMPGMDGVTATRRIGRSFPGVAVLMLSAYTDEDNVFRAVRAGAKGYLHENGSPEDIASAIRVVAGGGAIMSPEIAKRTFSVLREGDSAGEDSAPELTEREVQVIRAVARGMSNRQIAVSLRISERTVRNHAANIYKKLRIHDHTQAVLHAVRRGMIDPYSLSDV